MARMVGLGRLSQYQQLACLLEPQHVCMFSPFTCMCICNVLSAIQMVLFASSRNDCRQDVSSGTLLHVDHAGGFAHNMSALPSIGDSRKTYHCFSPEAQLVATTQQVWIIAGNCISSIHRLQFQTRLRH